MAWTYVPDFTLARDRIRLTVGDTDTLDQLVQDEEIAFYTTGTYAASSELAAAIAVQRVILTRLQRRVDMSAGGTSVSLSQQYQAAKETLARLEDLEATSSSAVPYAGGLTWSDRRTRESDTDRVPPYFDREPMASTRTTDGWR